VCKITNSLGTYTFTAGTNGDAFRCVETMSYSISELETTATNRTKNITRKARTFTLTGWLVDYDGSSPLTRKASIKTLADARQSYTLTCSDFLTDTPSVYIQSFTTEPHESFPITEVIKFTINLVEAV